MRANSGADAGNPRPPVRRPRFPSRAAFAGAAAILSLLAGSGHAQAGAAPASVEDVRMLPYIEPGQRVDVGGRRINFTCMGDATHRPTVILMGGLFSWSLVWYKTQAVIAAHARVCAFDRASYGFSDPAGRPQIVDDVVEDLHKALAAASLPRPYVLVGHSLGGLEARVYAGRWPEEVGGLVLIDTSPAAEGLIDENQPGFDDAEGRESYASDMMHCAAQVRQGTLVPYSPEFRDCTATVPADTPAVVRAFWPKFFTPDYFEAKVSLLTSLYTHRYDSADHLKLGALPLIVLSIEHPWETKSPASERLDPTYGPIWNEMHADLARLSTRGVHRVIKDSGHHIQLDQPQAAIDAVEEVVREVRATTPART